jgi:hypothetical protein
LKWIFHPCQLRNDFLTVSWERQSTVGHRAPHKVSWLYAQWGESPSSIKGTQMYLGKAVEKMIGSFWEHPRHMKCHQHAETYCLLVHEPVTSSMLAWQ